MGTPDIEQQQEQPTGEPRVNFADDLSQSDAASLSENDSRAASSKEDTTTKRDATPIEQMQALLFSRVVVGLFLIAATVAAGVTTYVMVADTEDTNFENRFDDVAGELIDSANQKFENALGAFAAMSATISGLAMADTSSQWPFYTQDDFEPFGQGFLKGTGADMVSWSPIVEGEATRRAWGNYSVVSDAWVAEGLLWQSVHEGLEMPPGPFDVPAQIYTKSPSDNTQTPEAGAGPFAPVWQMAGAPINPAVVNFNLLSDGNFLEAFSAAKDAQAQTFSKVVDASWLYGESALPKSGAEIPQGLLMTPLFEEPSPSQVVGVVVAVLSWDLYFKDVVLDGTPMVYVVVGNGQCGDTFTLSVEGGQVSLLGEGDKHDKATSEFGIGATFAAEQTAYLDCSYKITVYPSQTFVDTYINKEPGYWTLFVVGIILFISIVFFVYDLFVQKRQFKYLSSAARSNAIVSSLFPDEVRDRLFGKGAEAAEQKKETSHAFESSKFRLRNYLSDSVNETAFPEDDTPAGKLAASERLAESERNEMVQNAATGVDMYQTKPIADLFPNTTIMFADIAGFTAWSSVREPSQVFTLLESVYSAFDSIAKRRKVFKVETVGDCYVAVAGLPEPRADHALVMAKFSRECLDKFNELAKQLEITLGPDTADLAMRAGLHSGPVTAGVLRGDKSRFQLFGDTVNVAARVESSGLRNRVHISSDTAELLIQAGKEHWLKKRPDLVSGKGKAAMQTYWLQAPGDTNVDTSAEHDNVGPAMHVKAINKNVSLDELEEALPPKVKRLVGWNVEILKKLLQQILVKRTTVGNTKNYDAQLAKMEATYVKQKFCLDEVTEIISLPKFDAKALKSRSTTDAKVEIPEKVVAQLRLYVAAVAAIHRDNPFHNFEHASHVTMSVSKLLARIVAPDDILSQEEDEAHMLASLHDHTYGITSDPLTQFGCVLSALIHDTDHAGVSNFQLVKEKNKMATFFKEKSVAEQNSIVLAWEKLMDPRFEDLRRCIYSEPSELDRFRQLLVNNVLATDIFDKELQTLRKSRWDKAFQRMDYMDYSGANPQDDVNRKATIVMEHLIQASDVAHTMQHWHIYQKWNERLFAEMMSAFQAGRMEKDPSENWYQGELGFFDNYIIPLANKLKECGVFGVSSDEYLNYALENRREWANKGEEVVKRYMDKYCSTGEAEDEQQQQQPKE